MTEWLNNYFIPFSMWWLKSCFNWNSTWILRKVSRKCFIKLRIAIYICSINIINNYLKFTRKGLFFRMSNLMKELEIQSILFYESIWPKWVKFSVSLYVWIGGSAKLDTIIYKWSPISWCWFHEILRLIMSKLCHKSVNFSLNSKQVIYFA